MPRVSLICASALRHEDGQDLLALLEEAFQHSNHDAIDSMTLFALGNVLQVLEGEASEVDRLYQSLTHNPQHALVTLMARETVHQRHLVGSSLGYFNLDKHLAGTFPAHLQVFKAGMAELDRRVKPGTAHSLLQLFIAQYT